MFEVLNARVLPGRSLLAVNSISGLIMVIIASIGPMTAVAFHQDERALITVSVVYPIAYFVLYRQLANYVRLRSGNSKRQKNRL
jgi:hypothetical protein